MTRSSLGVLTAGVSLLALGVAAPPVFAQETETEGVRQTDPVNVYTVPAGDNREFGEEDLGIPGLPPVESADATVTCAESTQCPNYGAIEQEASGATFLFNDINIAGTQIVRASAIASATSLAVARALIDTGIEQSASGGSTAINRIDIFPTGTLQVRVNADAVATGGTAIAYGSGTVAGVKQIARASDVAANIVNNDGDFDIGVDVTATGPDGEIAVATMVYGLYQTASAVTTAFNSVNNTGSLDIAVTADANATTGDARATAEMSTGLRQVALGGDAGNVLFNTGALRIAVDAAASGSTAGTTVVAYGELGYGVRQAAYGGTEATNFIFNGSPLTVTVDASAVNAAGAATATASITGIGVSQLASATSLASNSIENRGAFTVSADAFASGVGSAYGYAAIDYGIRQDALANGTVATAANVIDNSGTMIVAIEADAIANPDAANAGAATAYGIADGHAINQSADAFGGTEANATGSFVNSGDVEVNVAANATGVTFAYGYGQIEQGDGLLQEVDAVVGLGTASARGLIANSGDIDVTVSGRAIATGISTGGTAGVATAYGGLQDALDQQVFAGFESGADAFAAATLSNSDGGAGTPTINLAASAFASGIASADAYGDMDEGIDQDVTANATGLADADARVVNDGSIAINVGAVANAADLLTPATATALAGNLFGSAAATAHLEDGIEQFADANASETASAAASILNSGSIAIAVAATANAADAYGYGVIDDEGIDQNAFAGGVFNPLLSAFVLPETADADAALVNSGALDISVAANAYGLTEATAYGLLENEGIDQLASAAALTSADADVLLDNSGAINIAVNAFASATGVVTPATLTALTTTITGQAIAEAELETGVEQDARADAIETVVSTGATPTVQYGGTANADATILNSGTLDVGVAATASAADARAYGGIEGAGVRQDASATAGDVANAALLIDNSGALGVAISANAVGVTEASATMTMSAGVGQDANALAYGGTANANATILNSGSLDILAAANAQATGLVTFTVTTLGVIVTQTQTLGDAFASAFMSDGVYQGAFAIVSPTGDETGGEAN
ncbi:MAG: beta strand repeat-containing protein, partial [Sphingomonadaceae bacterium]